MPETIACPFCNALITTSPDPISSKFVCPRCDQAFASKQTMVVEKTGTPPTAINAEVQRHREARLANGRRSVKRFVIVAVALAILGTLTGLGIRYLNRDKETPQPPSANGDTAKPVAPADMPGLAYLPAGTDSVVAVQFRPLLAALPEGQAKDPGKLLTAIGLPKEVGRFVEGLPIGIENVDQLVLGLNLRDGNFLKQIILVVHAREPFSMAELATRLNATKQTSGDRVIYRMKGNPKSMHLDLSMWAANDRVLVVALENNEIAPPHEGIEHLSPRLVERARNRFAKDAYLWAVFDSERWEILGLWLLQGLTPEQRKAFDAYNVSLSAVRCVCMAIRTDPEPTLVVIVEMKAEKTAEEFRAWLTERIKDEKAIIGGAGDQVVVQTPLQGRNELRLLVQKALEAKKKD